tara:strand:+ start:233 stop:1012 length:780 start_codon:yes stop_codon:yes gene_type:complete
MVISFIQDTPIHFKVPTNILRLGYSADAIDQLEILIEQIPSDYRWVASVEMCWQLLGKPYFEVYPKVLEGLRRTDLSLRPSQIPRCIVHDMGFLCVKFPVGTMSFTHMLVAVTSGKMSVIASAGQYFSESHSWDEAPFDTAVETSERPAGVPSATQFNDMRKVAIGVMFLANDPEYIKPIVLKRDEGKHNTDECVARARRRGVYGFTIGETVERSPHFRRPHFAIRWTGKGSFVPKLVPIRGACVGKQRLLEVPTGFER